MLSLCPPQDYLFREEFNLPMREFVARVTRRSSRISLRNQAEGIFPSEGIAIFVGDVGVELSFLTPRRDGALCCDVFSASYRRDRRRRDTLRRSERYSDKIINFNLLNRAF